MPPTTLVLLRHAEKPDPAAGVQGVDADGRTDPHSLAVRGWQRAGALVRWLAPADAPAPFGRPSALRAAASSAAHPSRRPAQTLTPLAQALGCALPADLADDDAAAAAATLLSQGHGTLVACARHDALPALARALALALGCGGAPVPPEWPADRYDVAWLIERGGDAADGAWRFRQLPQRLLAGDRDDVIG